jgi:hypothetical protein
MRKAFTFGTLALLLLGTGAQAQRYDQNQYSESDLRRLYDRAYEKGYERGYEDGKNERSSDRDDNRRDDGRRPYKSFTFGLYGGVNSTRFEGENVDGDKLTGRLGYQGGFFIRGGGRVFGQIGAEYLTSSNEFFQAGDGSSLEDIQASIDQRYIQIPAYVGLKLVQSRRGISAVRLQVGAEYAFPVGVNANDFDIDQSNFNSATVNGLVGLGFDIGPLLIGAVYHHGFLDVIKDSETSKRRILGLNVGFKF